MDFKKELVIYELENGKKILWIIALSSNGHPIIGQPVLCEGEPTEEELEIARQTTILEAVKYQQFLISEKEE